MLVRLGKFLSSLVPREKVDPAKEAMIQAISQPLHLFAASALTAHLGHPPEFTRFAINIYMVLTRYENRDETYVSGWVEGRLARERVRHVEVDFQLLLTETQWKAEFVRVFNGRDLVRTITFTESSWEPLSAPKQPVEDDQVRETANAVA